jgi:hypothetical protein
MSRRRTAQIEQIPSVLRERGPLTSPEIIGSLAMEPVKVLQALWRMVQGGELVIVDWRVALDTAQRQKRYRVYGVAELHQACDPTREAEVRKAHAVGVPRGEKPKPNYTYPPGTILPKPAPRARTKSGSGQVAGRPYHRGFKWFVNSSV